MPFRENVTYSIFRVPSYTFLKPYLIQGRRREERKEGRKEACSHTYIKVTIFSTPPSPVTDGLPTHGKALA